MTVTRAQAPVSGAAVLDALGAGALTFVDDGTIVQANRTAARILGFCQKDLYGANVEDVLCAKERLLSAPAGDPASARHELSVTLPDGSSAALGFSTTSFREASSCAMAHVVLFQEISTTLELRRERDRLLQMAALGDALPSVLHEIRNPLAAVTSLLEVLVEEVDDRLQRDLHAVLSEVRRINLSLQGIGGFAKSMRSGKYGAVDRAIRDACRVLEPAANRKGVSLAAVGPDLPLLKLDWGVISGLVFNLVKNGIEACETGGAITVDGRIEGEEFVLGVTDDGHGMTPEVIAHCCELFYTSKESGSGIGLALCRQVAESSGGRVAIESAVGAGTTVTVRVPIGTSGA